MHYVKAKGILSPTNGMNLYRGCSHGCIYCDSRSTCYQMKHQFEDIEVKENAIELLEYTLIHKRKKGMIGCGSMCDPYIPLERNLEHVRKALKLALRYGFGFTLITKSNLVLRDLDILKQIHEKTKCVVQMTLTTYDETLCKKIEPNVCTTKERFEVLCALRDAQIPTVVWLCPILPFINDYLENLLGILAYCRDAKVYGIINFGIGVTLREGDREYFYAQLDKSFPGMKERYIKAYGNQYMVNSPNHKQLMKIFHERCQQYGIVHDNQEIFAYLQQFEEKQKDEQLCLF